MKTNLSAGELPKKFKVVLNDSANTIIFTNSLTKKVNGKEVAKFNCNAQVSELL